MEKIESLKEYNEKAIREFAKNEEAQEEIRKRFSGGFRCNGYCNKKCKYAKAEKRFHEITGEEYIKYSCSLRCDCCC